ncbi:MAG: hypothetical protein LBQ68_10060 [Clostridiales bacterium]|jgi:hypothetical protein|nr:hypothetical protein [Clostridiales bacterium]
MFKFNMHATNDWRGDLKICIRIMSRILVFCVILACVSLALYPLYYYASGDSSPVDVYTYEDWRTAVNDPFVDVIILRSDIGITKSDLPDRDITIITKF